MSDLRFNCPRCRQPLEAGEDMSNETLACPNCGQRITVPAATPAAAADAVPSEVPVAKPRRAPRFFSLDALVTPSILRVLYVANMVVAALLATSMEILSLVRIMQNLSAVRETPRSLLPVAVIPLGLFLYLLFSRIAFEMVVVVFRIEQNTRELAARRSPRKPTVVR